jgi:hypothetical protein
MEKVPFRTVLWTRYFIFHNKREKFMSHMYHDIDNPAENIFKILDQVLETGDPATVIVKGKRLLISPSQAISKLDLLEEHPNFIIGDPEELVHLDWASEWKPHI